MQLLLAEIRNKLVSAAQININIDYIKKIRWFMTRITN